MNHPSRRARRPLLAIHLGFVVLLAGCSGPAATPAAASAPPVETPASAMANAPAPEATAAAPATEAPATESAAVQFIRMLDRDGDGRVSREEHAIRTTGTFDSMDADHDGKVTVAEMDVLRSQIQGEGRTSTADEIAMVDKDQDGVLSSDEHALATRVEFDRADADHDGFLVLAELEASEAGSSK